MNVADKVGKEPTACWRWTSPEDDTELFVVTENGYGKRTPVSEYPSRAAAPRAC